MRVTPLKLRCNLKVGRQPDGVPPGHLPLIITRMTLTRAAARRARLKLLGSILTTHGYAILAIAVLQPMLSGAHILTIYQIVGFLLGVAAQSIAINIAPYGEAP